MAGDTVRLGVIGFGDFAQFVVEEFLKVPGVSIGGLAGTQREQAQQFTRQHGLESPQSVEDLLARDDIDLVYIATPPFLHHPQAMQALAAGKHVICETPLAMTVAQANEMIAAAGRADRLVVASMMQRYNPLADAIGRVIGSRVLGEVLHGWFENYASDEELDPGHWFWNRDLSGGIFVEHGVHFFDLLGGWIGGGEVVAAQRSIRPTTHVEEQVHATVRYGSTILFDFYHGFHQTGRMDRQELRLLFERGDVTLHEWLPRWGRVHAVVSEHHAEQLQHLLPDAQVIATQRIELTDKKIMARHRMIRPERIVALTFACETEPRRLYGQCLRAMLMDQIMWIEDRTHPRALTAEAARDAVAMATRATELADESM